MKMALYVGLGGMLGTLSRYGCGLLINSMASAPGAATFIVNLIGSFFIGWAYGVGIDRLGPQMFSAMTIGVLGGFTTYSAFSNETFQFLKEGRYLYAFTYVGAMLLACLLATAGGYKLAA